MGSGVSSILKSPAGRTVTVPVSGAPPAQQFSQRPGTDPCRQGCTNRIFRTLRPICALWLSNRPLSSRPQSCQTLPSVHNLISSFPHPEGLSPCRRHPLYHIRTFLSSVMKSCGTQNRIPRLLEISAYKHLPLGSLGGRFPWFSFNLKAQSSPFSARHPFPITNTRGVHC